MPTSRTVVFELGGMIFEYDEEKTKSIFKSMVFLSAVPPVYSSIMTVLKCMMKKIAKMKTAMIPSAIHPQVTCWAAVRLLATLANQTG